MNQTTEFANETTFDNQDMSMFWTVQISLTAILTVISIILNGMSMITFFRISYIRKTGYFQILQLLSVANVLYYFLVMILRGVLVFRYYSLLPGGGVLASIIGRYPWILQATLDLSNCLLGLHAWILSVLTVDCRMNFTYYLLNRDTFVRGVRIVLILMTFVISVAGYTSVCVLRFGEFPDDHHATYTVVITYAIYILIFTILPTFMIVLVGVSNCVSFTASTRPRFVTQQLAMRLDRRFNSGAIVLLGLMLVHFTRQMSQEIEEKSEQHLMISYIIHLVIDVVLLVFPVATCLIIGYRCCCCPSPDCCQDPDNNAVEMKSPNQ